jgi:hypothetical protein
MNAMTENRKQSWELGIIDTSPAPAVEATPFTGGDKKFPR